MHDEYGVTFIEVITIIAIIGILSAMAIPRIGSFDRQTAYTTTRQIVADMRYARRLAITTTKGHIVRFYPPGGPYTEYRIYRKEGATEEQEGESRQIPDGVTCTGTEEFTFQLLGNASSDGTVSLSAEGSQYNVNVIAVTGRVS